jgi:hypothetical protein
MVLHHERAKTARVQQKGGEGWKTIGLIDKARNSISTEKEVMAMSRKRSGFIGLFWLLLGVVLIVNGCGGGGGGSDSTSPPAPAPTTLSGTAAAGAPIKGTVHLRDAAGTRLSQAISDNGDFLFDVNGLTAPYLLWADGLANAKEAFFYSTAPQGGRANVTPATHCIVAMALGKNPATFYRDDPNGAAPDAAKIDTAKQKLAALLAKLFETMGVAGFDLMTGQFAADGTGFDGIMDIVEMRADDEYINIVDRGSLTDLLKQELATGNVVAEENPEKVNEYCTAGMDVLDAVKDIFTTLSNQFATSRPTYDQLLSVMQQYMSDKYLDQGVDREQQLSNMAVNAPLGFKFENVALYRKMKSHTFGDVAPFRVDELPSGYAEGVWCTYTFNNGIRSSYNIAAFVRETAGGPWKMYGDQNPFQNGGIVEAESVWYMRWSPGLRVYSGLRFRTEDRNSAAFSRYGINSFMVLNSALPLSTSPSGNNYHRLILSKDADPSVSYNITSTSYTWRGRYFEKDGLDINTITDKEFVFVGLDSAGLPVNVWIDLLDKKPVQEAVLWKDVIDRSSTNEFSSYFSEMLSIWGEPSEVYMPPSSTNQSSIPLEWDLAPKGKYVDYTEVFWNDSTGARVGVGVSNPALSDASLNLADWLSTTLDISAVSTNWPPQSPGFGYCYLLARDEFERRYSTETDFTFANFPLTSIQLTGQNLHYRNYIDTSKNEFRGFIDFTRLGYPIQDGDIQGIRLLNLTAGTEVPIDSIFYDSNVYLFNNSATDPLGPSWDITYYSEYAVRFPAGTNLGSALYRYEATTIDGDVLTSGDINFVYEAIPPVDFASMKSEWQVNGDLKLSWTLPTLPPNFTQGQQRIWISDETGGIILLGLNAALTAQEVIIPKKVIERAKTLKTVDTPTWQIQMRYSATGNSNQSSRGMSERVPIAGWK